MLLWKIDINSFTDYDGSGYPVKDGHCNTEDIHPSNFEDTLPLDATHVLWFGR